MNIQTLNLSDFDDPSVVPVEEFVEALTPGEMSALASVLGSVLTKKLTKKPTYPLSVLPPSHLLPYAESLHFSLTELTTPVDELLPGLTPSEGRIVGYLMRYPNMIRSKRQIYEAVYWPNTVDLSADMRTIDVFICKIRKKKPDLRIETVWGQGYKYVGN